MPPQISAKLGKLTDIDISKLKVDFNLDLKLDPAKELTKKWLGEKSSEFADYYQKNSEKFTQWVDERSKENKPADYFKDFFELTEEFGFVNECHTVSTDDGYDLSVFRLRDPRTPPDAPVVFM